MRQADCWHGMNRLASRWAEAQEAVELIRTSIERAKAAT